MAVAQAGRNNDIKRLALGLGRGEAKQAFGAMVPDRTMRLVIPSATLILLGFQLAYGGFFASLLEIRGTPIAPPSAKQD